MKFKDLIMVVTDPYMEITAVVNMFGMKWTTNHTAEYFLIESGDDKGEMLLRMRVTDLSVTDDGQLKIVLE